MEVSMMFCGSFMGISEKLLGWFLSPKRQRGFKDISRKFQCCFKEVSRIFQESFKGVSRKFQGCFKKISRVFQECFYEVLLCNFVVIPQLPEQKEGLFIHPLTLL